MRRARTAAGARDPLHLEWWQTKTFWTSLVGIVSSAGAMLAVITGEEKWAIGAVSVGAFIANIGSIVARQGAVGAVKESPSVETKDVVA